MAGRLIGRLMDQGNRILRGTGILPVCPTGVSPVVVPKSRGKLPLRRMGETPMPREDPRMRLPCLMDKPGGWALSAALWLLSGPLLDAGFVTWFVGTRLA